MNDGLAKALAEGVRDHGADVVFGFPGGGPNLEVVGAVGDAGLRFVLTHGETTACMMAATYGLLTGRPGMAIATRGPGAACAVNGAAQATLDRFPLLVVTDCVPEAQRDRFAHQRFDQQQMFAPVTKWSGSLATSARSSEAVRAALQLAGSRPAGAVHLDYDPTGSEMVAPLPAAPGHSSDDVVMRAADQVRGASKPVVIVGLEANASAVAVLAAIERLGCPVLATYQAIGVVPEGHPQLAGLFTSGLIETSLLFEADLIVAIGFDQVEPMPTAWRYDVPVVAISEVAACATLAPITIEVLGPLATTLDRVMTTKCAGWSQGAGAARARRGPSGAGRHHDGQLRTTRVGGRGCRGRTISHHRNRRRRRALLVDHAVLAGSRTVATVDLQRARDDGICTSGSDCCRAREAGPSGGLHGR